MRALLHAALPIALTALSASLVACKREAPVDDVELERRLAAAEKIAAEHDKEWRAAMTDAVAQDLGPRRDKGRCPVEMPALDSAMTFAAVDTTLARVGLGDVVRPSSIAVIKPQDLATAQSLTARQLRYDAQNLRAHTDGTRPREGAYLLEEAQKLSAPSLWRWDALVIVEREAAAGNVDTTAGTFTAGVTHGRVLVFDYATHRVACASDFDAASSRQLMVEAPSKRKLGAEATAQLETDLLTQTLKAAMKELWVAGPRDRGARDAGPRDAGGAQRDH